MPSRLNSTNLGSLAPYALLAALFLAAIFFRPLLPVDETRYLSVAWEMYLHKQYALLTLNFEPYSHKPPFLFWMINLSWAIFGISRTAALVPVFMAAAAVLYLTQRLGARLLSSHDKALNLLPWLLLGAFPFLIYSSLMMFDIMLTAWLLATLILFYDYSKDGKLYRPVLAGLTIGFGVLTKGPVMLLYVLWPLALYKFWRDQDKTVTPAKFYKGIGLSILVGLIPVMLWLIPTLQDANSHFAFWLLWEQTAGRVTGNFSSSHARPFYFYFMLLPVMFLPWMLFPAFWRNLKTIKTEKSLRLPLAEILPVFICFCLISGKQPHYLAPLLPFIIIAIAFMMEKTSLKTVKAITITLVALLIAGQGIAAKTVFTNYDLKPFAAFYDQHRDADWAFTKSRYQGELNFLAEVRKPIDHVYFHDLPAWVEKHPNSYIFARYKDPAEMNDYDLIFSRPYRGRTLGVFKAKELQNQPNKQR